MFKEIIFALWFFLPAGIANVTPILVVKIPGLRKLQAPIDGGRYFRGKRLLGSHKTWRGFVSGVIMATVTLWLQQIAINHFGWARTLTSSVDYHTLPTLILGPLFGIGALGGDAIESFFKRQINIQPGHGWFPFDQTDYIIGGAIASAPFVHLHFLQYVLLLFIWLIVHVLASVIGYFLGLKERPI